MARMRKAGYTCRHAPAVDDIPTIELNAEQMHGPRLRDLHSHVNYISIECVGPYHTFEHNARIHRSTNLRLPCHGHCYTPMYCRPGVEFDCTFIGSDKHLTINF